MRINKNTLQRLMIILGTVCIIVSCSLIAGLFHLGDEAAVGYSPWLPPWWEPYSSP